MAQQLKIRPRCPICGQLMYESDRDSASATADHEFMCMCLDTECLEFGILKRVRNSAPLVQPGFEGG